MSTSMVPELMCQSLSPDRSLQLGLDPSGFVESILVGRRVFAVVGIEEAGMRSLRSVLRRRCVRDEWVGTGVGAADD